jgi:hypothetical protein
MRLRAAGARTKLAADSKDGVAGASRRSWPARPAHPHRPDITMNNPTLEDVLAYTNSDVVYRFAKTYGISREQSEEIFEQVKKWLWLGHQQRLAGMTKGLSIDLPLVVIDEMWHNFVLFTREYTAFCTHYFGYYLHHAPVTEAEDNESAHGLGAMTIAEHVQARKQELRPQYEYIYDQLGKDTFTKWYLEYPKVYGPQALAQMQLQAVAAKLAKSRHADQDQSLAA